MVPAKLTPLLAQLFKLGERILLVGAPGSAKTSCVRAACAQAHMDLLLAHPVTYDPTDVNGIPYVSPKGEAEFLPAGLIKRLLGAVRPSVCFFDDLIQAPNAVQAALMQIVLEREINGVKIPDCVTFCAASNRRSDKAGGASIITPLLNRFTVLNVEVDDDSWCEWALQNGMPPELVAYVRFKPQSLTEFSADSGRDLTPTTTPRSIAALGRLVAHGIANREVWAGAAGSGFAAEFGAFRDTYLDLPNADDILENPKRAKVPSRERPDVLYALMGALAYKADAKNLPALATYLDRCPIEFAVTCMKDALNRDKGLAKSKTFETWAIEHREAFGYGA